MTLMILASVSLLALVSSARPLPESDEHWKALQLTRSIEEAGEPTPSVEQAIQTVVKLHASSKEENLNESVEGLRVHFASAEEMQAFLSAADSDAVKLLVPLGTGTVQSPDEQELVAILSKLENERGHLSPEPDSALDDAIAGLGNKESGSELAASDETASSGSQSEAGNSGPLPTSSPIIALVAASLVALLAVACVAVGLYLAALVRASIFRSPAAWRVLSRLEAGAGANASLPGNGNIHQPRLINKDHKAIAHSELKPALRPLLQKLSSRASLRSLASAGRGQECEKPAIILDSDTETDEAEELEFDEKFFEFDVDDADAEPDSTGGSPLAYATPTATLSPMLGTAELPLLAAVAIAAACLGASASANVGSPSEGGPEMREATQASNRPLSSTQSSPYSPYSTPPSSSLNLPGSLPSSDASSSPLFQSATPTPAALSSSSNRPAPALPALLLALQLRAMPGGMDGAWIVRAVVALVGWFGLLVGGAGAGVAQARPRSGAGLVR